jgi:hypothetical protein
LGVLITFSITRTGVNFQSMQTPFCFLHSTILFLHHALACALVQNKSARVGSPSYCDLVIGVVHNEPINIGSPNLLLNCIPQSFLFHRITFSVEKAAQPGGQEGRSAEKRGSAPLTSTFGVKRSS